jgi:hypothetical protein
LREGTTVTEQRERLERALRACAEMRVPDTGDPWPAIRERVSGERMSGDRASEEHVVARPHRRRVWPPRLVPNTPLGWVLATLSVLILCAGAYAASGPVGDLLQSGLPGPAGHGVGEHTRGEQPEDRLHVLRTDIGQTQTADGARVTLEWAYADERFVTVGLHTQDLRDGTQKPEGSDSESDSVVLEPSLWDDALGNEAKLPPHVQITDASGQDFDTVGGGTRGNRARAFFDAPEGIEPGREHRFRLEVPLHDSPALSGKPEAGPFVFVFEVPVLPAPTIEVDQAVEAKGIVLTLERVVNSPVLPQAVVCFEPPDDEYLWMPWLKGGSSTARKLGDGCWSSGMKAPVEGYSSVTVAYLEGMPRGDSVKPRGDSSTGAMQINPKRIRGPWTFEFEAPGP